MNNNSNSTKPKYIRFKDPHTGKVAYIKPKDEVVSAYKPESQRRADDRRAVANFFRRIFGLSPTRENNKSQKTHYRNATPIKKPAQRKAAPAKLKNTTTRRRAVPTRTTPRYSNPKNVVHPDADDTPTMTQNPNYIPATDNIQFRPLNYFGMKDPYSRTAAQAFNDELAEKAARRQAVLDMYYMSPSDSSVSD